MIKLINNYNNNVEHVMCGKRTIADTILSVDHADDIGDIDHVTCEHAAILVTPNALPSH